MKHNSGTKRLRTPTVVVPQSPPWCRVGYAHRCDSGPLIAEIHQMGLILLWLWRCLYISTIEACIIVYMIYMCISRNIYIYIHIAYMKYTNIQHGTLKSLPTRGNLCNLGHMLMGVKLSWHCWVRNICPDLFEGLKTTLMHFMMQLWSMMGSWLSWLIGILVVVSPPVLQVQLHSPLLLISAHLNLWTTPRVLLVYTTSTFSFVLLNATIIICNGNLIKTKQYLQ